MPSAAIDRNLGAVDLALRTLDLDGPSEQERAAAFSNRMIQAQLRACLFLIAPHEAYIRP